MYIYIYVDACMMNMYIYVCTYIYIYICIYICIYSIYTFIHTFIHTCIYLYMENTENQGKPSIHDIPDIHIATNTDDGYKHFHTLTRPGMHIFMYMYINMYIY
jgi:hypothetical protein